MAVPATFLVPGLEISASSRSKRRSDDRDRTDGVMMTAEMLRVGCCGAALLLRGL